MKRKAGGSVSIHHIASIAAFLILLLALASCNRNNSRTQDTATDTDSATSVPDNPHGDTARAALPTLTATQTPIPAPTATPPSGTITLWHSWAQRDGDALEAILLDFQQTYPSIQIESLFIAQNDLLQSYAQAVADGDGPDVLLAPNWWLHELKTLGVVAPLSGPPYAASVAEVWPAAIDNLSMDGELYGIPTNIETVALYYNKDLITEDSVPQSLERMMEIAGQSPQNGIGVYANPFHVIWGFSAFGSELFDQSGRAILGQSGGSVQFLQWLSQLNALEGSYVDPDYGMLLDRFKRGEFAFFVDGPWSLAELDEALGDSLGVTQIPAGPGGPSRPWLYADAAYLNPNLPADKLELAALFIGQMTDADSAAFIADLGARIPANQSADLGSHIFLEAFARQAANADGMTHGPEMDAFWRYGGDMILKALVGVEDMQSIVTETDALINDTTGK